MISMSSEREPTACNFQVVQICGAHCTITQAVPAIPSKNPIHWAERVARHTEFNKPAKAALTIKKPREEAIPTRTMKRKRLRLSNSSSGRITSGLSSTLKYHNHIAHQAKTHSRVTPICCPSKTCAKHFPNPCDQAGVALLGISHGYSHRQKQIQSIQTYLLHTAHLLGRPFDVQVVTEDAQCGGHTECYRNDIQSFSGFPPPNRVVLRIEVNKW